MMNDFEIFDGKTFRDLCKDVVERSQSKKDQVDILITDVRNLIKTPNDAVTFLPRLKELIEVGVKNDEQIIKLASVLQRLQSTQLESSGGYDGLLSEEEKEALQKNSLEEVKLIKKEIESIDPIDPLFTSPPTS